MKGRRMNKTARTKRTGNHWLIAILLVMVLVMTPVLSPLDGLFSFLVSAENEDTDGNSVDRMQAVAAINDTYHIKFPDMEERVGYTMNPAGDGVDVEYDGSLNFTVTIADGYSADGDRFAVLLNGDHLTPSSINENTYTYEISNIRASGDVMVDGVVDNTAPTAKISVTGQEWMEFLNDITFGLFFNYSQTVIIEAEDAGSGLDTIEYYLTDEILTLNEVMAVSDESWTGYTGLFDISPEKNYIIYVRTTDKDGNTGYYCSDGIVLEVTKPIITGITNGATYCESVSFTVTDDNYDYVRVDGEEVAGTAVQDAQGNETGTAYRFTLEADNQEHVIEAHDKASNTTTVTVTVNDGHTYVYTANDTTDTITETCEYCDYSASVTLTAPSGTLIYDGTSHDAAVSYTDTLSGGNSLAITYTYSAEENGTKEVVTSTVDAGYYTASITCGGKTVSVDYEVAKVTVDAPVIEAAAYTGSTLTADVKESTLYTVSTNDGGIAAGSYDVVLTLTDSTNYEWRFGDGTISSDGKSITLTFTITDVANGWVTELSASGWTYGDSTDDRITAEAAFGTDSIVYTYYLDKDGTTKTTAANSGAAEEGGMPVNAGTYYVQASVAATSDYGALTSDYVGFTIAAKEVTASISGTTSKTYDGTTDVSGLSITLSGVLDGDTVSAAAADYAYNSADVADAATITASGITLSGEKRATTRWLR